MGIVGVAVGAIDTVTSCMGGYEAMDHPNA